MSRGEASTVAFTLAVVAVVVLYLAWWHAGELEDLNRRVDELELARRRRAAPAKKTESEVVKP